MKGGEEALQKRPTGEMQLQIDCKETGFSGIGPGGACGQKRKRRQQKAVAERPLRDELAIFILPFSATQVA